MSSFLLLSPTLQLRSTDINTRGFDSLLNLVNNTQNDSFDLYYGLFLYNKNATDELERLEQVGLFVTPRSVMIASLWRVFL